MVQLAAEAAGAHRGCQVDAGGRDDPHVHWLVASAAKPAYLSRLDRRQQLDLQRVGKLPDLVEEQRAVMGRFDQSLLGGPGVGERSALETEELRLQEGVGDRGAVDIDERAGAASSAPVEDRPATNPFPVPVSPRSRIGGGGAPSSAIRARRRICPRSASSAALWPMSSASGRRAVISPRPLPHRRGAAQNRRRAARSGGFGRLKASNFARFRESSLAPRMRQSPDDMNGSPLGGGHGARPVRRTNADLRPLA